MPPHLRADRHREADSADTRGGATVRANEVFREGSGESQHDQPPSGEVSASLIQVDFATPTPSGGGRGARLPNLAPSASGERNKTPAFSRAGARKDGFATVSDIVTPVEEEHEPTPLPGGIVNTLLAARERQPVDYRENQPVPATPQQFVSPAPATSAGLIFCTAALRDVGVESGLPNCSRAALHDGRLFRSACVENGQIVEFGKQICNLFPYLSCHVTRWGIVSGMIWLSQKF